jgi:hypothetical protein
VPRVSNKEKAAKVVGFYSKLVSIAGQFYIRKVPSAVVGFAFCVGVLLLRTAVWGIYPLARVTAIWKPARAAVRAVSTLQLPLLSELGPELWWWRVVAIQ